MAINEAEILETMRLAGYRLTGPRRKLVDLLVQAGAPLTAEEIHQLARRARLNANLSTIYRNLATFCEMGWLEAVPGPNGERHYQIHNADERMSVRCLDCGQLTTLNVAPGQRLNAVVRELGFNADSLRVTLAAHCAHPCEHKDSGKPAL
ncbi:MAG: transcriptional repressor [Anaerolineales bacterium]|nr:transcriptional repressor [Anaerolineales bacterium]